MDWDFLLQKLSVFLVWAATFAVWNLTARTRAERNKARRPFARLFAVVLCALVLFKAVGWSQSAFPRLLRDDQLDVSSTLEAIRGL